MENISKIAVIGGTGKSGKYLVQALLNLGIPIKMLVRNPEKITLQHQLAEVIVGNVNNETDIRELLSGCSAVISALGMGMPPSETNIFSTSTGNILKAMKVLNIRRYIVITGLNVDTPVDRKGPKTKFATEWMYTNYPQTTTDKQTEYRLLSGSDLDWTMVRLPMIDQTDGTGEIQISLDDCLGDKISAVDLAQFLTDQLTDTTFIRKAPFIANRL
jgi:putative NADH-flavin reductase